MGKLFTVLLEEALNTTIHIHAQDLHNNPGKFIEEKIIKEETSTIQNTLPK
jgi:hypothetical protein